jgi:hypothetical protein
MMNDLDLNGVTEQFIDSGTLPTMNQTYSLETLAAKAVIDFRETIPNDVHSEIIQCEGGFQVEPPLPAYDVHHEGEPFLVGEQIPPEVRNKPQPRNSHNKTLDDDCDYIELDLMKHLDDSHIFKRLSIATAHAIQLPVSTVFLTGIGVFSSIACRRYVVNYEHGGDVPIGHYVIAEQPSGTGKSWCLTTFQKPFFKAHKLQVDRYKRELERLQSIVESDDCTAEDSQALKDLKANPPMPLFSTNPSPEALEQSLNYTRGFFSAVSSEQGMINTLLGLSYGDGKRANNNDLLLNGYDGGHINSQRVGREGYCGQVIGALVSFAQNGSIEKMLDVSNGTGLAERCLFAAEPHYLGKRDKWRSTAIDGQLLAEYDDMATELANLMYRNINNDLSALTISKQGHRLITEYLVDIEPFLSDGDKYSHSFMRGAASKLNIQIMKLAANLHLSNGDFFENEIPDKLVNSAIAIINDIFNASVQIAHKKGVAGEKAEFEAVINYLTSKSNKTEREIINSLRTTMPFKNYSGNKWGVIKKTIQDLNSQGVISESNGKFSIV